MAIEKASPAVVNISTEQIVRERVNPFFGFHDDFFKEFDDFFNDFHGSFPTRDFKRQTLGSGVIIDKSGYVLTNQHVIMQASKITVTLPDNREFEGRLVGADPNIDLAIVKIDVKSDLPVAVMGNSDSLMIGETVIAIGNPFGLEHTVTTGVLSAKNRSIKGGDGRVYNNFLQTDASINPGNSGGPLVNIDGEVVGINTAIYAEAQGIGFAIPIDRAGRAITDLIKFGKLKRAWVGARVQALTKDLADMFSYTGTYGVLVSDVLEGSPAAAGGLLRGDIVLEVGGTAARDEETFYDRNSGALVGEKIKMKIFRNGKETAVVVAAGALPIESALKVARQWLGIEVASVNQESAHKWRLSTSEGVVVTSVNKQSVAYATGVREGDVIHQLGETSVKTLDDFKEAALLSSERSAAVIMIQRGRNLYYATIGASE